jgi:hypothetical protein
MDQCANKLAAASHRICTHGAAALLADDSIDRPPERTHRTAGRVTSICFLISCSLQARSTPFYCPAFTRPAAALASFLINRTMRLFGWYISAYPGLSWLISSHRILFILPAEHYSFYQPNTHYVRNIYIYCINIFVLLCHRTFQIKQQPNNDTTTDCQGLRAPDQGSPNRTRSI